MPLSVILITNCRVYYIGKTKSKLKKNSANKIAFKLIDVYSFRVYGNRWKLFSTLINEHLKFLVPFLDNQVTNKIRENNADINHCKYSSFPIYCSNKVKSAGQHDSTNPLLCLACIVLSHYVLILLSDCNLCCLELKIINFSEILFISLFKGKGKGNLYLIMLFDKRRLSRPYIRTDNVHCKLNKRLGQIAVFRIRRRKIRITLWERSCDLQLFTRCVFSR